MEIDIANASHYQKRPIGMIVADVEAGDPIQVWVDGVVANEQWNFPPSMFNQHVYCDSYGNISLDKIVVNNEVQIVGRIISKNTILLHIITEIVAFADTSVQIPGPAGDKGEKGDPGDMSFLDNAFPKSYLGTNDDGEIGLYCTADEHNTPNTGLAKFRNFYIHYPGSYSRTASL